MVSALPPDLILLICEELANQNDFHTLFNCALSGKLLTGPALMWMYRYVDSIIAERPLETPSNELFILQIDLGFVRVHTQSSIRGGESNEAEMSRTGAFKETSFTARLDQQTQTVSKWSLQWRSIILSSIGKTKYPYCLYIRSLDLTNLEDLLMDNFFRDSVRENFFANDMAQFRTSHDTPAKTRIAGKKRRQMERLKVPEIVGLVGEAISKYVGDSADKSGSTAALEELSGQIGSDSLSRWVARLSRLKSVSLWDGTILNGDVGRTIQSNCHNFDTLTIHHCFREESGKVDADLAAFFKAMDPNTLRGLQVLSTNDIGPQTLSALANHESSLNELVLGNLKAPALKSLNSLHSCVALQTVDLHDTESLINLETTANDIFLEIVGWLTRCTKLKHIRLKGFVDGPALLRSICLKDDIRLKSITLVGYSLVNNQDFHRSLTAQSDLESLELRADAEDTSRDDIDTLVASLCTLKELRYLNVLDTSDYFRNPEVHRLAESLLKLEEFSTAGYDITDLVWPAISNLHHLRSLYFHALTSFTFEGILNYISTLHDTNAGLLLSVMCASLGSELSPDEQAIIRDAIADKVDGRFDFELHREDESSFDGDSD